MKLKKMISILVATVIVLSIAAVPVFAVTVVKDHEYMNNDTVDCYSFSGYFPDAYAFAYSFMTAQTSVPMNLSSVVIVDVDYLDGTRDYNNIRSDSTTTNSVGDGIQPYVEVIFDEDKVVSKITYTHFYYLDGNNIHNRQYESFVGRSNG